MSPYLDPQKNHNKPADQPANTRGIKNKSILIVALVILILILAAVMTFMLWPGNISRQEAMEIALEHVGGGRANTPERDFEAFRRVWSVEVFYDGFVHEVYVSRMTGEIVRVELDRWD